MLARDVMTKDVVTVSPDTPVNEVARLFLDHGISAAPVVDATGTAIGMVSEGDLIERDDADRAARRDWWLVLLADGEEHQRDFLQRLCQPQRVARNVMAVPVISVTETTEAEEIVRVLTTSRIKRVPVVRDGRVTGIVSRADLLQALGAGQPRASAVKGPGVIADLITAIDDRFDHRDPLGVPESPDGSQAVADGDPTVAGFRDIVADFEHQKAERRIEARHEAQQGRRNRVKELIGLHVTDESWRSMIHHAREAAEHGAKEVMVLRFPSTLCTDGGRAVNALLPDWPETLRGEAGEIYLRWQRDLKSRGFHLVARVLDFPEGMPGDIGLFLVWGE